MYLLCCSQSLCVDQTLCDVGHPPAFVARLASSYVFDFLLVRCHFRIRSATIFNNIAIQGTPQMAIEKKAISLSILYSYYSKCNLAY